MLGTMNIDDLKRSKNMNEIVRKSYVRMQLLHRSSGFTSNVQDLWSIYLIYIRSVLECCIYRMDLARVILKGKYTTYKEGLRKLSIETLDQRRERFCFFMFAQNCLKNEKVSDLFHKKKKCIK
jgi:hypothetical protein